MTKQIWYAQGDIMLECVADAPAGRPINVDADGAVVLARGEVTGHRHAFYGGAVMFRDDGLAREVPAEIYLGHVKIAAKEGALYQQYKLEGKNIQSLYLEYVFQVAARIEKHLLESQDRIAKIVVDAIADGIEAEEAAEAAAKGEQPSEGEPPAKSE